MAKRRATSLTLEDMARRYLNESDESACLFLRQSWLSHVISSLRSARVEAGLTQKDVAERLGTTQSAIARLENDDEGSMSLRRVIDYALACGTSPFDLSLASFAEQRAFALEAPDGIRTERAFLCRQAKLGMECWSSVGNSAWGTGHLRAIRQVETQASDDQGESDDDFVVASALKPLPTDSGSGEELDTAVDEDQLFGDPFEQTMDSDLIAMAA